MIDNKLRFSLELTAEAASGHQSIEADYKHCETASTFRSSLLQNDSQNGPITGRNLGCEAYDSSGTNIMRLTVEFRDFTLARPKVGLVQHALIGAVQRSEHMQLHYETALRRNPSQWYGMTVRHMSGLG